MRGGMALACAVVVFAAPAVRGQALKVGDAAPGLAGGAWVQGEAVAPEKGGQVCVIEFWATWCPPCRISLPLLDKVQDELGAKGVVCVAVSDEAADVVRKFVTELGEKASFRVVADPRGAAHRAYLSATGVRGIPYAFVIDRAGRIAWHGHPLDDMDTAVKRVLAGEKIERSGPAAEASPSKKAETEKQLQALREAADQEDWDKALRLADALIEAEPEDLRLIELKLQLLLYGKRDPKETVRWGRQLVDARKDDPTFLNELSWRLLTMEEYGRRCPELAMYAAQAAQEQSGGKRADIADTYARALYQAGLLDEAIKTQEEAVRLARESAEPAAMLGELESVLAYYEACRAARALAQRVE